MKWINDQAELDICLNQGIQFIPELIELLNAV